MGSLGRRVEISTNVPSLGRGGVVLFRLVRGSSCGLFWYDTRDKNIIRVRFPLPFYHDLLLTRCDPVNKRVLRTESLMVRKGKGQKKGFIRAGGPIEQERAVVVPTAGTDTGNDNQPPPGACCPKLGNALSLFETSG